MTVKLYGKEPLKLCLNNYFCTHGWGSNILSIYRKLYHKNVYYA